MGIKISGAYKGQFTNNVPSVGSRMGGVVSPSYGKPRIIVRFNAPLNPVRQDNTGQYVGGQVAPDYTLSEYGYWGMQSGDTHAENPRRLSRRQKAKEKQLREFLKIKSHLAKGDGRPRLVKPSK